MKWIYLLPCVVCLSLSHAWGFSSHQTELTRSFDRLEAVINSPVTVKVNFTNNEAEALHGFYYTEQIPAGISLEWEGVSINGRTISGYILEAGAKSDIYPDSIPYRLILENPPLFEKNNPILPSATIEITYRLTSAVPASYDLDHFNWAGCYQNLPENERAAFGYSEEPDKKTIRFIKYQLQAVDDGYTIEEGGLLKQGNPGGILTNDIHDGAPAPTILLDNNVSQGSLTLLSDGSFTYSHDGSESQTDLFRYHISDGTDHSNIATVLIHITPVNDAPQANDDIAQTKTDMPVRIEVCGNDTDVDGDIDPTTITIAASPASGSVKPNNDGSLSYTPNSGFIGTDTIRYNVKDDQGALSNEAVVTISVNTDSKQNGNSGGCFINSSRFASHKL